MRYGASHVKREDILPGNLKMAYGETIDNHGELTPLDVQLFLSLFYHAKDNEGEGKAYYELDKFSRFLHIIEQSGITGNTSPIELKLSREIDHAILCLLERKVVEEVQDELIPTAQARTIGMLLGLHHFLGLGKNGEASKHIDRLSKFDHIVIGSGNRQWYLSYPLLLVQAVRFCQWEYQNQDYCFEYYTAKRARKYFENKFKKWSGSAKWSGFKKGIDTLTRLIRWHTIEGQFWRNTSNFGLETICSIIEQNNNGCERPLLYAMTYADAFIRMHKSDFEKKVKAEIFKRKYASKPTEINLLNKLKKLSDNFENKKNKNGKCYPSHDLCDRIKNCFPDSKLDIPERYSQHRIKKDDSASEKKLIWSFSMPRGDIKCNFEGEKLRRHEALIEKLNNEINIYIRKCRHYENTVVDIRHNCVLRNQRNIGVLSKILEDNKKPGNPIKIPSTPFFDVRKGEILGIESVTDQINKEFVSLVAFYPRFVASQVYGLELEQDVWKDVETPLLFLKAAFEKVQEISDESIPLPMVKRITDLLEFYSFEDKFTNTKPSVFPLTISFDKGKETLKIWLPEELSDTENKELKNRKDALRVSDILIRYIHCIICNYGMTKQFRQVDLDFSSARNFKAGEPHPWRKLLDSQIDTTSGKKELGLHVFERYLTDVGIEKQETLFSREVYQKAIEKRKIVTPHQFDKSIETVDLDGKYILGIDIGGSGIKIKLFKITSDTESVKRKPGNNSKNERKECYKLTEHKIGKADGSGAEHLFLIPETFKKNGNDLKVIEFSIPTAPPVRDQDQENKNQYENAEEFAAYVVNMFWRKIEHLYQNHETSTNVFNNIISIGFCWPGPIKQNRIASTSGILRYFKGFSNRILGNEYSEIMKLDIAEAVRTVFREKLNNDGHDEVMVALANDGDVEAAGLAFGMTCGKNSQNQFYNILFDKYKVAVIKAGTGTAGSVLDNGEIKGLNEFGKLVVDLGVNNTNNLTKPDDQRWPGGDANKFFSMTPFRKILLDLGVPENNAKEITGRDMDLLLKVSAKLTSPTEHTDENIQQLFKKERLYFGALEFIELTAPYIEWDDLFNKEQPKKNLTIKIDAYKAYQMINKKDIDAHTWWNIANEPMAKPLSFSADNPHSLFRSHDRDGLIERLGNNRIARMNFEGVVEKLARASDEKKPNPIIDGIKKIGRGLAHIITLLYDIYGLKAVFISGGVMNSEKISKLCLEGLKPEIEGYFPGESYLDETVSEIKKEERDPKNQNEAWIDKRHLIIKPEGSNHALLGAAVLGFDYYIEEKKIAELQKLAKKRKFDVNEVITFLTRKEAIRFLKDNAGRLRITVDDDGTVESLN